MALHNILTIDYFIQDLSESERNVIVKKLELIKDKFYNSLNIQYSMVKGEENWVWVKNGVDLATGVKLFEMFNSISSELYSNKSNCTNINNKITLSASMEDL